MPRFCLRTITNEYNSFKKKIIKYTIFPFKWRDQRIKIKKEKKNGKFMIRVE
jgi:hypothetical protein